MKSGEEGVGAVSPGGDWEHTGCLLCGSPPSRDELLYAFDTSSYRRCGHCGLVYLSPRLRWSVIAERYQAPGYFEGDRSFGYATYAEDGPAYRRTFERRLAELQRFAPGGRILDIGCGSGLFLDVAAAAGYEAWGLDLSESAVQEARETHGDRVRVGPIEKQDLPDAFFDVVTLFDVFEHLYDPLDFVARLARLLVPCGVVAIATPNYGSWLRRLLGRRSVSFKIPEHVAYYTRETLGRATASHFRLECVRPIGQYCTMEFLCHRIEGLWRPLGPPTRALVRGLGLYGAMPYVASGSLLAILVRHDTQPRGPGR